MKKYDISVVCLTFNSDYNKLLVTLNSILKQKNVSFEIIVADDGSEKDYSEQIKAFFKKNNFSDFIVVRNKSNVGTVKNFLNGVKYSSGEFIKDISPGDYLYQEDTLDTVVHFMRCNNAKCAFGGAVYYSDKEGFCVHDIDNPSIDYIYDSDSNYDYEKTIRYQILYSDFILGAKFVFSREMLLNGLEAIKDFVVLAEDIVVQFFVVQKCRIYRIPSFIIWYEYGTGISTSGNSCFGSKIYRDNYNFRKFLTKNNSDSFVLRRAYLEYSADSNMWHKFLVRMIHLIDIDRRIFKMKKKKHDKNYKCTNYNTGFFESCNRLDGI